MSILHSSDRGWFISHQKWLADLYSEVGFVSVPMFDLETPFRMDAEAERVAREMEAAEEGKPPNKKKKKQAVEDIFQAEKKMLQEFLADLLEEKKFFLEMPDSSTVQLNNTMVRARVRILEAQECPCEYTEDSNDTSISVRTWSSTQNMVLPPNCRYIQGEVQKTLPVLIADDHKFDLVLLDPPWENKHVKREAKKARGYDMLTNETIGKLPVDKLVAADGAVVVWCTTSERHCTAVGDWMTQWGFTNVVKWYWLKVTQSGEPIVAWDKGHKQPFEIVYIGTRSEVKNLEQDRILCSVPSAVQSHKPPILQLIHDQIKGNEDQPKFLEVFGRYLVTNCTTVGNECCKFQDLKYYQKI